MQGLRKRTGILLATAAVVLAATSVGRGQAHYASSSRGFTTHVIVPQARASAVRGAPRVEITGVKVGAVILEQAATTTMDVSLRNPTGSRIEAELLVPVPEGAVVRGFSFSGAAKEPTAELLPKKVATETYKAIVAKMKDPAMLEFAGWNLIRSSVFPVEAHGTQSVRLTYEHLLPADGLRVDYVLPRTESIDYKVPWEVAVRIRSKRAIATVYSPSHQIETARADKNVVSVKIAGEAAREPGPVQISYLHQSTDEVTASLLAYPDPKVGGGYFLLLAGMPPQAGGDGPSGLQRELTVVIDRSGSMGGQKIEQVRAAALQVVEGLKEGEAVNVIDYSDSISSFAPAPIRKTRENAEQLRHYIRRISAGGGTNLHDALLEALRPEPMPGALPIVLFLTDGQPTVGVRDEPTIRGNAVKANVHKRRIFTFGVGYDVNAPLLGHLAENSRATSTYVLPNENVEAKISQVFRRLEGPILAGPSLTVLDAQGQPTTRRVSDLVPGTLPDLFEGDQLVLLGKYREEQPLRLRLNGLFRGKPREFKLDFQLDKATTKNNFVPRLWASRKIAALVDEIRQAGAGPTTLPAGTPPSDPRMKELVDEIVRLSVEFGILTEYTAFLAKEGTDLTQRNEVLREAQQNFFDRAQRTRSGIGAVNQAVNTNFQRAQVSQNRRNAFYDQNMNRVQVSRVQQISDRAFFQRGNRWVDGAALNARSADTPDQTVTIGSPEFMRLVDRLAAENRQGTLSMSGEILLHVDGKNILVKGD